MTKLSSNEFELINNTLSEVIEKKQDQIFMCKMSDRMDQSDYDFVYKMTREIAALKVLLKIAEECKETEAE